HSRAECRLGRAGARVGAAGGAVHRQAGPARGTAARGGTRRPGRIVEAGERSLHAPLRTRGSSSIAEQVASYHQVPVQIRPPALSLSLSSGASLTPSRAPTTMYGGHLFQGDPVLTVALWQLATGSALAPAPAP